MHSRTSAIRLVSVYAIYYAPLALILVLGLALRLRPFLLNRSLWFDEAMLAVNIVERSFGQLVEPLEYGQGAPAGFLWLSKTAILLLGNQDWILRLIPFIAALLSLILMARLVADIPPKASGLVALLLYGIGARSIYYATEFKQYSSDTLIALVLLVLAMPLLSGEWQRKRLLAWAAVGVASLWFSHPALFVFAGIWIALAVTRLNAKDAQGFKNLAVVAVVSMLSFAAMYMLMLRNLAGQPLLVQFWSHAFMPMPPWANPVWFWNTTRALFVNPVGLTLPLIGPILFLIGAIRLIHQRLPLALALLLPLALALAASALRYYPFGDRMLLFAVPSVLVVVTQGIAAIASTVRRIPFASAVTWVTLTLLLSAGPLADAIEGFQQPYEGEQVRPAVEYLAQHWQQGDTVYVYYGSIPAWRYYAPLFNMDASKSVIRGLFARSDPGKYRQDFDALPGQGRLWLLFSHVHTGSQGNEEELIAGHARRLGPNVDVQHYSQAGLYLFSLEPTRRVTDEEPSQ